MRYCLKSRLSSLCLLISLCALSLAVATPAYAQAPTPSPDAEATRQGPPWVFFVELQPMAFITGGMSLGASVQRGHWRVGGGGYVFPFPSLFIDLSAGNADQGWQVSVKPGLWLEGNYAWHEDGHGLSVGANLTYANIVLKNESSPAQEAAYQSLVVIPKINYTWIFWDHLYIQPGLGIEIHTKLGGQTRLDGREFEPLFIQPLPSLAIGLTL